MGAGALVGAVAGNVRVALSAPVPKPELAGAARDFEALLLHQFLKAANEPVVEGLPFGQGPGERMYRDLFLEEVARLSAERGGVGLARAVEETAGRGRSVGDEP